MKWKFKPDQARVPLGEDKTWLGGGGGGDGGCAVGASTHIAVLLRVSSLVHRVRNGVLGKLVHLPPMGDL